MAEAAVVTFFIGKLNDLVSQEANLLLGVDEQVRLLQNKLDWMLVFLKAADVKRREDERVKLWVRQIRDVTFHAEDVIDEFMVKISTLQYRQKTGHGFVGSLTRCISCTYKLPLLHELANQIKDINAKVEEISANKSNYGIETGESLMISSSSNDDYWSTMQKAKKVPIVEEADVVGNEDSIQDVKSLLLEGEPRRTVVSIVGMGGLGKTTLAKKVYESSNDVKRSFDCFAWVYVSQQYHTKELMQGILKCFKGSSIDEETEDELRKKLHEHLQGSKYLIVLDDIWNVEAWDDLNTAFPDEKNGSRVLITTRNKEVALHADPSESLHELRFLNEMESWELFFKKIFPLGGRIHEVNCPSELEDLGKKMVAKCGGLPLAIVVLGGLVSRKDKTQIAWSKVNDSVSWQLSTHGVNYNSCLGILALSYYDLPYYLKSCFLYIGLFPEDCEIRSSKLIQYWIAEGFIQKRGEQTLEDVAEDYLEELIHRSMIQVARRKYDGNVKTCRIHDLLRDLSIKEAKEDQFLQAYTNVDDFSKPNKIRRLTIHNRNGFNEEQCFSQFRNTRRLRSLLCFRIGFEGEPFWRSLCGGLKLLRVLELDLDQDFLIHTLPEEIGELIHLTYLGIGIHKLRKVPESIGKLVNLQTLNLKFCSVKCMPSQIWSLHKLSHLYVLYMNMKLVPLTMWDRCRNLRSTSCHLGVDNLTNLQTLCIKVGDWINGGGLGKLRMLKKLIIRGSLVSYQKVISDSITKLNGLRSLSLWISKEVPTLIQFSNHTCLTKLYLDGRLNFTNLTNPTEFQFIFPPNLNKLTLCESRIEKDQMVILEKLSNLRFLELHSNSYTGKKMICSQGGFPQLQVLGFYGLTQLEEWIVEDGALTGLIHLTINGCKRMEMLPNELCQLTTLQELKVDVMPKKFMARLTENVGDDWDKIKHIPSLEVGLPSEIY
ncbi:Disease resistance protein [Macleaya cordata]|uniref:Disease resistance protein n=1 Tax=Macleaya cordata TaxID=56857 RepID=A0A200Q3R7_MACCD|nr:Disease resistance protein [Macleaya cordata]